MSSITNDGNSNKFLPASLKHIFTTRGVNQRVSLLYAHISLIFKIPQFNTPYYDMIFFLKFRTVFFKYFTAIRSLNKC